MDLNKRNKNLLLFVIVVILSLLSTFLVINMFKNNEKRKVLEDTEYAKLLSTNLGYELGDKSLKLATLELNEKQILVTRSDYSDSEFLFDFVITEEGIQVTSALKKSYYDLGLIVGDIIVKVDDVLLSEKDYFEVIDLLYKDIKHKFELKNGDVINYEYKFDDKRIIEEENEGILNLTLFDLDSLNFSSLYNLTKDYEEVIIDLNKASINSVDAFRNFLSLFKKDLLFKYDGNNVNSYNTLNIADKKIQINGFYNQNQGVLALLNILKSYNLENVIVNVSDYKYDYYMPYEYFYSRKYVLKCGVKKITWGGLSEGSESKTV